MKKHFKWLAVPAMAVVMLFSVLLAACDDGTEYKLNRTSAELFVGKTVQLTVEPEAENVEWGTSDAAIATVSDGLVTAVAAGEAEITATIGETELVCGVTVTEVALESISVNFNAGGPTIKFYPTTSLEELRGYLTVSGTNNDGSAVSIDKADVTLSFAEGETSLKPGENTITVTYQGKTDTFTVNVENVTLESIAAKFDAKGAAVYTSATEETLKQYITVTGTNIDESTAPIAEFTVILPDGGLKAGDDNTVTVTAGGKTTTVTVTGVQEVALESIAATFDAKGAAIYTSAKLDNLKQYITLTGKNNDGSAYTGGMTEFTLDYKVGDALTAGDNTLTVTFGGKTCEVTVTGVQAVALASISATVRDGATVYVSSDLNDAKALITLAGENNDGTAYSGAMTDFTLAFKTGNAFAEGDNVLIVTFNGISTEVTVKAVAATLESISAEFDAKGAEVYTSATADSLKQYITVTGTYSDESTAPIAEFTVTLPGGGLKAGDDNTVTVAAGGKTTTVTVTGVQAVALASITAVFANEDSTPIYTSAAADSLEAYITVTGTNNDGTPAAIEDFTVTLPDGGLQAGTNTVTVSVGSVQTTAEVTGVIAVALESIEATFDAKGATIYTSATAESLKQYITVSGTNNDGSKVDSVSDFTVTLPENGLAAGANTVTVAVGSVETTVSVEATAVVVTGIEATFDSEAFGVKHYTAVSPDDLKEFITVTATYSDGTSGAVSADECTLALVEGAEAAFKAGANSVNVTYAEQVDTITVTLSADEELLADTEVYWSTFGGYDTATVQGESDASLKFDVSSTLSTYDGSFTITNPAWDIQAGEKVSFDAYITNVKAYLANDRKETPSVDWTNFDLNGMPSPLGSRTTTVSNVENAASLITAEQWIKFSYVMTEDRGDTLQFKWQFKEPNVSNWIKNSEGVTAYYLEYTIYLDNFVISQPDPEEIIVKSGTSDPANSPNAVIDKTIVYSEGGSTASVKINASCASYFTGAISIQNVNWDIKTGDTISWYIRLENLKGYLTYNDRNNGTEWSDISIVALPTPIGGRATTTDMIDGNAEYVNEGQWYKVTYTAASDLGNTIQLNWGSKVQGSGTGSAGTFTTNSDGTSCYYFSFDAYIDCITVTPAQA